MVMISSIHNNKYKIYSDIYYYNNLLFFISNANDSIKSIMLYWMMILTL